MPRRLRLEVAPWRPAPPGLRRSRSDLASYTGYSWLYSHDTHCDSVHCTAYCRQYYSLCSSAEKKDIAIGMAGCVVGSAISAEACQQLEGLAEVGTGEQLRAALARSWPGPGDVHVDDIKGSSGYSLLQVACVSGNASCVRALLNLGASQSRRSPRDVVALTLSGGHTLGLLQGGLTCLHLAAGVNSDEVIRLLLNTSGADVNARSANMATPLMVNAERFWMIVEGKRWKDSLGGRLLHCTV